jgi:hypothetical protein
MRDMMTTSWVGFPTDVTAAAFRRRRAIFLRGGLPSGD